jgi:hypothetical protein
LKISTFATYRDPAAASVVDSGMSPAPLGADLAAVSCEFHIRFREAILGAATRSMLSKPLLPILFLFSH